MQFEKIDNTGHLYFAECWKIYSESFPFCERRDIDAQARALSKPIYNFCAIIRDESVVGLVGYWLFDDKSLFLEHIAISSDVRGGGIGSAVMEHLKSFGYPIILEIEPVVDDLTRRRLDFYMRMGMEQNSYQHKQPPFRSGEEWLPLVVLSYPKVLSSEEYNHFRLSQIANV